MLHSIATVSISGTLAEKIAVIAKAGFGGVEILESDLLSFPESPRKVGDMLRDYGLVCTAYQPFRDFEGMPDDLRQRTFDRMERKFDVAAEIGAELLFICSNVSPHALDDHARIVADFREAGDRASRRNMMVGFEALSWGRHINDHRDAWRVVRDADHPCVGLILDSFHSFARQVPSESIRKFDPAKIVLVQIADAPFLKMDELSWSRHFRCMPGQGDFPLVDYVGHLAEIGYDGPISLEIFNDRFRAASAATIAADGRRSLIFLEDQVRRRRGEAVLTPRVSTSGVEFIEFAASEEEGLQLAEMLKCVGFREAGRHKRKAVSRWRQGEINLIINSEAEGFAHAHDLLHGCSVCAIGVTTGDAIAALARAQALRMESFSQPVAPGEYAIPAVRGVGGSLIYFVDAKEREAIWREEFDEVKDADRNGECGLTRIDHIAQSMRLDETLTWLLYYASLFDVQKTPQLEIVDPLGIVQSQAVENADRSLRITMNGSSARDTLSARFLSHYIGAGVQHIAFATDDIFKAATRANANGANVLPMPAPYYDDLEAKFGLDPRLVARMREFNILYDREGDAEYFQFYLRAFSKRFFFEIVQRVGYDAYGAANAPIRLAAQSRFRDEELP